MIDYRPSRLFAFVAASTKSFTALLLGGGFLWYGLTFGDMPFSPRQPIGHYSFHIGGAIFIAAGLLSFAYNFLKSSRPSGTKGKLSEGDDGGFDADAALEHYLASRNGPETKPSPSNGRPVFGKKNK
jgi:hypothetical protein